MTFNPPVPPRQNGPLLGKKNSSSTCRECSNQLTGAEWIKLAERRRLKETFGYFWHYKSVFWAGGFLDYWCFRALRSRLEPMKKVARMLRAHEPLLLNFSGERRNFQWSRRRPEQQDPSGNQTILRLPHLRSHGNRPLPQLRTSSRAGNHP